MIHNIKPNALMEECLHEAEQGDSIYTKAEEEEIRLIFHEEIRKGSNFNRIYDKRLKENYPLPKGNGLFASYARLRDIWSEEVNRYKKETKTDKELMWNMLYERYNELYFNEADKHDIVGQKKLLDSMMRLITAANQEKVLENPNQENVEYHLSFDL